MADGWVELDPKKLDTHEGVAELNRMLQLLFDTIAGDGNKQKVFSGSGTPEGAVVADIGSIFMRLDGGTGSSVYRKESGVQTATGWVAISNIAGSGAPVDPQYVTLATDATLTNERVLTAGTNISLVDGGAGSTITISATGGSPGGSDTQVQFNDGGSLGGDANFTWNKTTDTLTLGSDPTIQTPDVTGASNSEDLTISIGYAGGTGDGGILRIQGGDVADANANGGYVYIEAGDGGNAATFTAGEIDITAGSGGNLGGSVYLRGGNASATNGDGGYVVLVGGDGRGTGLGGIVELQGDTHTYTADPVNWFQFSFKPAGTTVASGVTITKYAFNHFDTANVNGVAGGATETVTTLSNVYIEDAPGGSNRTVTNGPYALFVDAGLNRFDGNGTYVFELPADATDPTAGGGAATGRIPVLIGGATRYLAYY